MVCHHFWRQLVDVAAARAADAVPAPAQHVHRRLQLVRGAAQHGAEVDRCRVGGQQQVQDEHGGAAIVGDAVTRGDVTAADRQRVVVCQLSVAPRPETAPRTGEGD